MEKKSYQSNYYNNVSIQVLEPNDSIVLQLVEEIKYEIMHSGDINQARLYNWYENWQNKDIEYTLVAVENDTNKPFGMSSYKSDGKVLCYLYALSDYRVKYRDLAQIDYLPLHVKYCTLDKIYLSIHAFTKSHERLAKAWNKKILNGGIPEEVTPYKGRFKYCGVQKVANVDQHVYELEIK